MSENDENKKNFKNWVDTECQKRQVIRGPIMERLDEVRDELKMLRQVKVSYGDIARKITETMGYNVSEQTVRKYCTNTFEVNEKPKKPKKTDKTSDKK